ncbi:DUF3152 domain-containing protein [Streptomyces sp. NPDC048566]|uniref:DUF3152 domain-containing protein n=1 Tax=Streptomyces sp. NPDC048566 TaxID=3365569 RepID=UPI00371B7AF5
MGRHSRRGRADKTETPQTRAVPDEERSPGRDPEPARRAPAPRGALGPRPPGDRLPRGTAPRADATPSHGFPRLADGTPARGTPRFDDGTPAHGFPSPFDGTPAHGTPRVRGGHPEQREPGGGWGESGDGPARHEALSGPLLPRQRREPSATPRQAYVDAFDAGGDEDGDLFTPRTGVPGRARNDLSDGPRAAGTAWDAEDDRTRGSGEPPRTADQEKAQGQGGKGRAFTGIAAAAVTTVLAVVVAGQVATGEHGDGARAQSAAGGGRVAEDPASRGDGRPTQAGRPGTAEVALTYDEKMAKTYALGPKLKGPGKFDAVPGSAKAPGKGRTYTYRVDVEQGLGLDSALFAEAVHKTLNDPRSWAHDGARAFERISSGKPDFVITLASPGTTAQWCAKSGLDTTEDNVSCDSAATERIMINAYRWAQGAKTYGDKIYAYRQMLINHEVGHRLGYGHVNCDKDGELAPVMQQQTKFLDHDGIHCLANPWVYPKS